MGTDVIGRDSLSISDVIVTLSLAVSPSLSRYCLVVERGYLFIDTCQIRTLLPLSQLWSELSLDEKFTAMIDAYEEAASSSLKIDNAYLFTKIICHVDKVSSL